jgi:hypothetical protein
VSKFALKNILVGEHRPIYPKYSVIGSIVQQLRNHFGCDWPTSDTTVARPHRAGYFRPEAGQFDLLYFLVAKRSGYFGRDGGVTQNGDIVAPLPLS